MSRCRCPILWATTVPGGKKIPLDPVATSPTTRGALFVVDQAWAYSLKELSTRIAQREQLSIEIAQERVRTRYPAHEAHFTRCPDVPAQQR